MSNIYETLYEQNERKLTEAVKQLGSYDALIYYAVQALEGRTANSPEEVALILRKRNDELINDQDTLIFNRTKIA
jgi:hypothetical protein